MRRFTGLLVVLVAVAVGLGVESVPEVAAAPTSTQLYSHRVHVTELGYRVNDPCPRGTTKFFVARGRVGSNQTLASIGTHYVYLARGIGRLHDVAKWRTQDGNMAHWYIPALSRSSKVSSFLSGSYTIVQTDAKTIIWSDYLSRQCVQGTEPIR
jgi:hypothetical protein